MEITCIENVPAPTFDLRYEEEAKDHFVKVTEWLKATCMDDEWEILLPQPNQLLLDYDCVEGSKKYFDVMCQFATAATALREAYDISYEDIGQRWTKSKSGNVHGILTLPENIKFGAMEAAAWQAAFGSDSKRESLHIKSVIKGSKNPNLLIERKKPAQKLLGDGQ